jgi:segregation and condensation protein B
MDENVISFPGAAPEAPAPEAPASETLAHARCPPELLVQAVEACLFAVAVPVTESQLMLALGAEAEEVRGALTAVGLRLEHGGALRLVAVGEGWQIRTQPRLAPWVASIRGGKPTRLTRPALETLAVVAFRQPVTKGAIDEIRGVDSGGILRALLDRGLVRMSGRSEEPGRPMLYATTNQFLQLFGMRSLADLPTLRDLRPLDADDSAQGAVPLPVGESGESPVLPFPGTDALRCGSDLGGGGATRSSIDLPGANDV